MAEPPTEFGKRTPVVAPQPSPPVKRSGHVALLLMGTMAVGGTALAVMPRQNCQPNDPAMASPASPETARACGTHSSWGHGGSWSHSSFYSGSSSSSGSSTSSSVGETTRGGFGSFARSISAHFSGG